MYDINRYTDIELYNILELVQPSDRVLEARIIQLIHKYDAINNESGKKMTKFFKDIYNHFFYDDDDIDDKSITNKGFQEGMNEQPAQQQQQTQQQQLMQQPAPAPAPATNPLSIEASTTQVKTVEYTKDYINPLLKQTIKRTISIDSQYRDRKYSNSTDFTFNLSEPLRDVVALRLYSIQIPYAWYTINKDYGGNYFYLKGISPGIDNGSFDYQIDISSGNYSPNELATTVNNSITKIKIINPEVNFGSTQVSYNGGTNRFSTNIEIENVFNETNYEITFLNPSNKNPYPMSTDISNNLLIKKPTYTSMVSAFLGFNYTSYSPKTIYSNRNIPSTTITTDSDNKDPSYYLDPSNNYFTIYQYKGPLSYNTQNITFSTNIQLSLLGSQTRTNIFNEVNTQLQNNPYLINSSIYRTDISSNYNDSTTQNNYNIDNDGNSFYGLTIELNKKTTTNYPHAKTVIVFPTENNSESIIWVKNPNINNCCFNFASKTNEINTIKAETSIIESTFLIDKNPYIVLKCTAYGYSTNETYTNINILDIINKIDISNNNIPIIELSNNKIDISNNSSIWNDYIIKINNSDSIGYDLTEYINTINTGILNTNESTKKGSNTQIGVFNMDKMRLINNLDVSNNLLFRFDVNKRFTTELYSLDLSDTILYKLFGLGADIGTNLGTSSNPIEVLESDISNNINNIDLSSKSKFTSRIGSLDSYNVIDLSPLNIIKIFPNYRGTNNTLTGDISNNNLNVSPPIVWNIKFIGDTTRSYGLRQFIEILNLSFNQFKDGDSYPLIGSEVTYIQLADSSIRVKLSLNINKILTENDYKVIFYDPSGSYTANNTFIKNGLINPNGTWKNNFNLDISYNLTDFSNNQTSYTDISINNVELRNFYLQEDVKIMIRPILTENNRLNNNIEPIYITIPATTSFYTIGQLKTIINNQFDSSQNSILNGSYLDYAKDEQNIYYVSIRMNINNVYTANDYKLVFYDLNSFVKCYVGSSSVRNVTWDSTIGWILGFREEMEYYLNNYTNPITKIAYLTADTVYSSNLYNYFLVVLDDYTQSHLNDGLVTLTQSEEVVSIPSYAPKSSLQCDTNEDAIFTGTLSNLSGNNLTQNQIYSANEIYKARKNKTKNFSLGPYIQDIFGFIPIKVNGLSNGTSYVEFGGTLQNQDRLYFGPVNIHRMTIKLINDKGNMVDLNGCNWSFSFICEQLYQQKSLQ